MICISVLLCDRKHFFQTTNLSRLIEISKSRDDVVLYFNIQSSTNLFDPLLSILPTLGVKYEYDKWSMDSTWFKSPSYDQDQSRLAPIVIGRNMTIDFALSLNCSHIFFIDSDVIPPINSLDELLKMNKVSCGGLVPGRGIHSHVNYVFAPKRDFVYEADNIICDYGTMGCCLIEQKLFSVLRFRWGADIEDYSTMLSEDPAYFYDAFNLGFDRFVINTKVICQHLDDPTSPLDEEGVSKDNFIEIYTKYK
jgi:hypothetical protein